MSRLRAGSSAERLHRSLGFATSLCLLGAFVTLSATQAPATFSHGAGTLFPLTRGSGGPSPNHPVTLTIRQGSSAHLRFDGLMPGTIQTRTIGYSVASHGSTLDLWIVFDRDSAAYQAFTGAPGRGDSPQHAAGGLGPYAYFALADSSGGPAFESGNLQFIPGTHNTGVACLIDPATGRGSDGDLRHGMQVGHWRYPVTAAPTERKKCGVPAAVRLASGLRSGAIGAVSVTLGLDPAFTEQDATLPTVPFTLVVLQHGAPNPCPVQTRQLPTWHPPTWHPPTWHPPTWFPPGRWPTIWFPAAWYPMPRTIAPR